MMYKNIILFCIFTLVGFVYPQSQDTVETDPVNITAKAVINRYLYAIGGIDKFKSVIDRTTVMTGTAMAQPINIMIMQKYPDKLFQELQAGEVKQLLYYNNGKGTMIIGDERINIEDTELERLTMDANMQLLLDP